MKLVRRDWAWAMLLVALNLAFFGDALFSGTTFFARDVSTFHYPLKKLVTESYARGEWPLWNPFVQMGQPLLANPNSLALYPTQVLFQCLPFETALELHFVLHCALAGIATFYLARKLGLNQRTAFFSAVVYNFSGVTLSFLNLFNILPVVAFLPLLSLVLLKVVESPTWFNLTAGGLLFGCFFLLLEPLSSIATALFLPLILFTFMLVRRDSPAQWIRAIPRLLLVVVFGVLLAAVQIVPTAELARDSGRSGGLDLEAVTLWSLHPANLVQTVCPTILGEYFKLEAPAPWAGRWFDHREPYLLSCYFGAFPLLLAGIATGSGKREPRTVALLLAGVTGLWLALGKYTPLYAWLFEWLPIFRYGRYPVKFLLLVNLCVALLAGFGLNRLESWCINPVWRVRENRKAFFLFWITLVCLLASTGLFFDQTWRFLGLAEPDRNEFKFQIGTESVRVARTLVFAGLEQVQVHLAVFLLFLVLLSSKRIRTGLVGMAAVIFVLVDLLASNLWINPLVRSEFFDPAPAAIYLGQQARHTGPFRVYRFEPSSLRDHPAILYQTDSVVWLSLYRKLTLYPFLAAKDHVQYAVFPSIDKLETLAVQRVIGRVHQARTTDEKLRLLAGLNVKYVLALVEMNSPSLKLDAFFQVNSDQPLRLYELTGSLPRAFLTESADLRNEAPDAESLSRAKVTKPGMYLSAKAPSVAASSGARVIDYSFNRVELESDATRECELVLLDSYYPGWKATVDGSETQIRRFQETYRAVTVPPGKHRVTFRYEPRSFCLGLWISGLTILGWAAMSVVRCLHLLMFSVRPGSCEKMPNPL